MGEDILSVIFLALICIVIAGIVHRIAPGEMMMPTFAVMAVCLWIAYDFMLIQRHKAKHACKHVPDDVESKIKDLTKELNANEKTDEIESESKDDVKNDNKDDLKPEQKHENEFDIAMYDKALSVQELYKDTGCAGDTRIANRMKYMGLQAKLSQDIRARWNAEKFRPYFEEELRDGENRDWWDVDADYLDLLM